MSVRFLLQYLRSPALVGAVVPSSPALARAMSREAEGYDHILELGAGTGPITKQLASDHADSKLTVFELDSQQAQRLALAHPRAQVWDGCLHERADVLLNAAPQAVAVSSLPFRSLPESVLEPTVDVVEAFLLAHPKRKLVQFTYGLREPFTPRADSLAWKRCCRVWSNLPPASVWVLQHRGQR